MAELPTEVLLFPETVKIYSGNSNPALAKAICQYIGINLGRCNVSQFPDGETFVKIDENVRGSDVFVIQSTCPPANHYLMELFIMIDALRRASAARITAVIPFYGYARQDRKDQPDIKIELFTHVIHVFRITKLGFLS